MSQPPQAGRVFRKKYDMAASDSGPVQLSPSDEQDRQRLRMAKGITRAERGQLLIGYL
jgi:hypothetical protein